MVTTLSGMPANEFSQDETAKVTARYPRLLHTSPSVIEGTLDMNAEYDGVVIADGFVVRITASNPNSDRLPALYEVGGRTQAIATKYGIRDHRDLHCNTDGTACVCVKQVERRKFPPGSDLIVFMEDLAVPYLYGLKHFERFGRWPWGDYSHGGLGLLEFSGEDREHLSESDIRELFKAFRREANWKEYNKQLRKPSAERKCPCDSGKPFSRCHGRAWCGVLQLRAEMQRLGLSPRQLEHQR